MSETPLPNSPDARTPTGEIKNVDPTKTTTPTEPTPTGTETTPPSTTGDPPKDAAGNTKSLLDVDKDKAAPNEYHGAPEKYADYKAKEGFEIDPKLSAEANDIFRKMGLSQKAGQELVDFYSKHVEAEVKQRIDAYQNLRKDWREKTTNDPEVGGNNLEQTKATISRVLDAYPDQSVVGAFKEGMNLTGAGDQVAFVKVFHWMAKQLSEGGFVRGNNPAGQTRDGGIRPSSAKAMFPGLPSASDG